MAIGQYVVVNLVTLSAVGGAVDLPFIVNGLADSTLSDLFASFPDHPEFKDIGYWKIVGVDATGIGPGTVAGPDSTFIIDPVSKTATEKLVPRPLTDQEMEAYQYHQITIAARAIQNLLNSTAAQWGYDDITSASTYLNSAIPQFKAEANALTAWRDNVWYQSGTIQLKPMAEQPATVDELLSMLPKPPARPGGVI